MRQTLPMLSQIGPYFIDEELASGGMARVFKGRLRGLGGFEKVLVIKQIHRELAQDPAFVEMFVREANTLVSLSHPHIVPVYELFSADGTYFLSMEYVEGATLAQLLEGGPLAPTLVAHMGAQLCDALDYAHRSFGILHRDVTPRNVIVDNAGHARLLDFGIAGVGGAGSELALGSAGYAAPEQVRGEPLSEASDLFALGAVLFEALTAEPAFAPQISGTLAPFDIARLAALEPELARLLGALLAMPAQTRPRDAREVGRTLRAFLAKHAPHGVVDAMEGAVQRARARRVPSTPHDDHVPATAPLPAKTLAASPVLTEILRTAGGSPIPQPPAHAGTRPIRERSPRAIAEPAPEPAEPETREPETREPEAREPAAQARSAALTRAGFRAWPVLALLTLVLLWALGARKPRSELDGAPLHTPDAGAAAGAATPAPALPAPSLPVDPGLALDAAAPTPPPELTVPETPLEPSAARATLTLSAEPWAEVSIDGKAAGTTPLRNLRLRPGAHRLDFACPALGSSASLRVELAPGAHGSARVDLHASPPRTFLDGVRELR